MFENSEISIEDMPTADSVTWLDMDPNFTRRLITQSVIGLVTVSIGIAVLQVVFGIAFADEGLQLNLGWLWLIVP